MVLGPKFSLKERRQLNLSRFYAIAQIEYCRNFIFKRHFPIHKLFERCCELGLWRLTGDKVAEIFGMRVHRRMQGKLAASAGGSAVGPMHGDIVGYREADRPRGTDLLQ